MRNAYKRRPQDFKRCILARVHSDRKSLLEEEYKWLQLISDDDLGSKYYNISKKHFGHWSTQKTVYKSTVEKMKESQAKTYAAMTPEEKKEKFGSHNIGRKSKRKGMTLEQEHGPEKAAEIRAKIKAARANQVFSEETLEKMSGKTPWNKGKTDLLSEETRQKMAWSKGKKLGVRSENVKKKISEKNKINTKRCWQDPEYREKMSKAAKGRKWYKCHETGKRIFYRPEHK